MYMYDPEIGEMDVELDIPEENPRLAEIGYGYLLDTFRELSPDEIEYLNDKYKDEIVVQAATVLLSESPRERDSVKLLH